MGIIIDDWVVKSGFAVDAMVSDEGLQFKDFIEAMTKENPEERPSLKVIISYLALLLVSESEKAASPIDPLQKIEPINLTAEKIERIQAQEGVAQVEKNRAKKISIARREVISARLKAAKEKTEPKGQANVSMGNRPKNKNV